MSARTRFALAIVGLLAALATAAPASGSEPPGAAHTLTACLRHSDQLLVVADIDRSGSIAYTDPEGRRVDGISAALIGLERLTESSETERPTHIEVLLSSFAGTVEPSAAAAASQWQALDGGTLDALLGSVAAYAHRDHGRDTDYVLALTAAQDALERTQRRDRRGRPADTLQDSAVRHRRAL